jgi:hypothetical protein
LKIVYVTRSFLDFQRRKRKMSTSDIVDLLQRMEILERKTSRIPHPDIRIPGDFEGLGIIGELLGYGVLAIIGASIVVGSASFLWERASVFYYDKKK